MSAWEIYMQELEYKGRWNIETLRVDDKACMRRGFYWWSDAIKTVHSLAVADQIYLQRVLIYACALQTLRRYIELGYSPVCKENVL